jgi:hypothetical protein
LGVRATFRSADSEVDLDTVIEKGRGRRTRRRVGEVGVGLALAALLIATVAVPHTIRAHHTPAAKTSASKKPVVVPNQTGDGTQTRTCPVTTLALPPGGKQYTPNVMDPAGRYIGGFQSSSTMVVKAAAPEEFGDIRDR